MHEYVCILVQYTTNLFVLFNPFKHYLNCLNAEQRVAGYFRFRKTLVHMKPKNWKQNRI